MTEGTTEWDRLIAKACQDLHARTLNDGDWPNGIPETFYQIKDIRGIQIVPGVNNWVSVVENIVKNEAVRITAETQALVESTWDKLKDVIQEGQDG